MTILLWYK